jgi:DNA-3-methyladenine glycosylase
VRTVPLRFYQAPTEAVARKLLGLLLCHRTPRGLLVGRIVETEAYLGSDDAASHAARGRTARNRLMFSAPGHAYVYFSYGMHWCFNAVAYQTPPGAVLVRALEPLDGVDEMARLRGLALSSPALTNGPGKLTRALAIERAHNGVALYESDELFIAYPPGRAPRRPVESGPRIGIRRSAELPLRFFYGDSAYLSRRLSSAS